MKNTASNPGKKETILELELESIEVDHAFNMRKNIRSDSEDIKQLAASIAKDGLLENLVVREVAVGNRCEYHLLAGFRRFTALKLNGAKTARCLVKVCSDEDAFAINFEENVHQKPLRIVEEIDRCTMFYKEMSMPYSKIADTLKISPQKVKQLTQLGTTLPEQVLMDLRTKECKQTTLSFLTTLLHLPPEKQLEEWDVHMGRIGRFETGPKKKFDPAQPRIPKMIKREELVHFMEVDLKDADGVVGDDDPLSTRDKKIIRTVLRWVVGNTKVHPLKMPPEEVEPSAHS